MLLKKRITNLTFILLLFSIFLLNKCDIFQQKRDSNLTDGQPKDSVAKHFHPNGKLSSYVTYRDGQKHGVSRNYYSDGQLKIEVEYENGLRHGVAKQYYQTGKLYQITPYKEGLLHGTRKKYFKNGTLMAEIPFENGNQIFGMKEYTQSGKVITEYPEVIIQTKDNTAFNDTYTITLKLSRNTRYTQFFVDKFLFTRVHENFEREDEFNIKRRDEQLLINGYFPIFTEKGVAEIVIDIPKGEYVMQEVTFAASFLTRRNNTYLMFKTHNLSIENRY